MENLWFLASMYAGVLAGFMTFGVLATTEFARKCQVKLTLLCGMVGVNAFFHVWWKQWPRIDLSFLWGS